ncbi:MAG: serine--tRNA ligase [Anaerolineales bacterium]|nr:serine--tRNA ligase [Anaerolineales bacterium]
MLDINLIREKPEWVKAQLHKLNDPEAVARIDKILELDVQRRALLTEVEALKAARNKLNKPIGQLRGNKQLSVAQKLATAQAVFQAVEAGSYEQAIALFDAPPAADGAADEAALSDAFNALFEQMKGLSDKVGVLDEQVREVDEARNELMLWVPNLPHESVPVAESDEANIAHPVHGTIPSFDFEPKPHWEIGVELGLIDLERGVKLGGTRFYILAGMGAALQRALINFLLDQLSLKHGFQEMYVPLMVKPEAMYGSGQFPKFIDTSYQIETGNYMLPTAEVAIANMLGGEVLNGDDLPMKFVAHTPCFRQEKMSAGRDVRGIKRVHQFEKVEMFQFTRPGDSYATLEAMTEIAESLCAALEIPYRRLEIVTGDLGFTATKKYDVEMWSPGTQEWLEVSSCSNTEDFQARRANIKYRDGETNRFVHMLNGSGLGIPRTLIAIMENYQTADGCIRIPTVLQPYMGGLEVIERR